MMKKVAIIHTSPATVESLKALAAEILPGYEVVNFLDDSILPQLNHNGGDLAQVQERVHHYARFAESVGADVILEACSSIGELVSTMQQRVSIPVVRIDENMAEEAIRRGRRIGVAATLATTLNPTKRLLEAKAREARKEIEITAVLVEGAYQKLMAGDKEAHDALITKALADLVATVEVVVLAQASMARVVPSLPASEQEKILSSPRLAVERVKAVMEARES